MHKRSRQNVLIEIIENLSIFSQAELAAELAAKGFKVTQASVSRDLDELDIVKVEGRYVRSKNVVPETDLGTVTFDTAGENLIVGRCASGLASAITVRIDRSEISAIVGTIAGDDTIFIAVKDPAAQKAVLTRLVTQFGRGE